MTIRKMEQGDVPYAAVIEKQCFSSPQNEGSIRSSLESPQNSFFVAEEGELLGYIGLLTAADQGYILSVAVAPEHRRQGVGRALVNYVISAFRGKLSFVSLEVRPSNTPAVSLYSSLGFVRVGERKSYYRAPVEDALLMTKYFDCEE